MSPAVKSRFGGGGGCFGFFLGFLVWGFFGGCLGWGGLWGLVRSVTERRRRTGKGKKLDARKHVYSPAGGVE